jgi:hypothetical protein
MIIGKINFKKEKNKYVLHFSKSFVLFFCFYIHALIALVIKEPISVEWLCVENHFFDISKWAQGFLIKQS